MLVAAFQAIICQRHFQSFQTFTFFQELKKAAMEKLARALAGQQPVESENKRTDVPVDDITELVRKKAVKRSTENEDSDAIKRNKTEDAIPC